jgi:hypothetical protein
MQTPTNLARSSLGRRTEDQCLQSRANKVGGKQTSDAAIQITFATIAATVTLCIFVTLPTCSIH